MKEKDKVKLVPIWKVEKRKSRDEEPYEIDEEKGNLFLDSGINHLWDIITGDTVDEYDNANARIGVGDDDTPASSDQTGLQGTAEFEGMESGYPQAGADQLAIFRAEFGEDDGNFHWHEMTVDDGSVSLNRYVSDKGVKEQGDVWTVTLVLKME